MYKEKDSVSIIFSIDEIQNTKPTNILTEAVGKLTLLADMLNVA